MKQCFKCKQTKPLSDFYKHSAMTDGHLGKCKDCAKADVKKHRVDNSEYVRAYDRKRASEPHRRELSRATSAKNRKRFPEKCRARNKVSNAIRDGRLERLPCVVCGDTKSEAHHTDYSKPFDVVWLCSSHHKQEHQRLKEVLAL